jgi:hypothetical protein
MLRMKAKPSHTRDTPLNIKPDLKPNSKPYFKGLSLSAQAKTEDHVTVFGCVVRSS